MYLQRSIKQSAGKNNDPFVLSNDGDRSWKDIDTSKPADAKRKMGLDSLENIELHTTPAKKKKKKENQTIHVQSVRKRKLSSHTKDGHETTDKKKKNKNNESVEGLSVDTCP